MERPFADRRPIGPLAESGKEVLGIPGTPMPNREKVPMVIVYKLEGDHIVFMKEFAKTVSTEIDQMMKGVLTTAGVTYKESGVSSKADFSNQALMLRIGPDDLPMNDSAIHRVGQIIRRVAETEGIDIQIEDIFIEQE